MAKPTWTNAQIIGQLDTGNHWSGSNLTYAFPTNASWLPSSSPEKAGFTALTAEQRAAATSALAAWDSLIAPNFSLTTNAASANIKFGNSQEAGYAYAYYPSDHYVTGGSVWFNPEYDESSGWNDLVTPTVGDWGYATYIHEIGHALGLDHPGEYNGGNPTYANDALFKQDSVQYTIMSYFKGEDTGADWVASDGQEYDAQTPMLYDILVIQQMYGADTTTRAGNTAYGYSSTDGEFVYDFTQNLHPIICIYDAGGVDTLDLSGSNYSCTLDLTPGSFSNTDMMTSNISIAFGTWIENATGGTKADTITGNSLDNVLSGMAGNDTINGGGGNDTLDGGTGADTMKGGSGNDTYIVDNAGDVITEAANAGIDTVKTAFAAFTLTNNLENLTFIGTGAFSGTGNASSNIITGGNSDDTLNGGAGADSLIGGAGHDIYIVDNIGDVITEGVSAGTDTVKATAAAYTLADNLENLIYTGATAFTGTGNTLDNVISGGTKNDILYGGIGSDTLNGNADNDTLDGGAGADTLIGGAGNDTYVVDNDGDVVTEAAQGGTDTVQTALTAYTLGAEIENLTFTGSVAFSGTGNTLNNILTGGIGGDTLDGGAGADTLIGGAGNDIYIVDNAKDVVKEALGAGTDTIKTTLVAYTLGADVEHLTYTGTVAFTGNGNGLDNTITGGIGNDTLNGGTGTDTLIGGLGDDTFVVDNAGDIVTEASAAGTDIVKTTLLTYTLGANVENLAFTGSLAFTGTGNGLGNVITGGAKNDILYGGGGIDTLNGAAGNDTLDGGTGADTLVGGAGNDIYIVDEIGDVVAEVAKGGSDTVQTALTAYTLGVEIENLTFTGSVAFSGTGNALNNIITGGIGGDTLDGGAGADTLIGGAGNDIYIVDNSKDVVKEALSAGIDTVKTTLTVYTLGADVEHLTYTGASAFTGNGNGLDNTITGGIGNDTLNGGAGADTLIGGAGNDTFIVDNAGDVVTEVANAGTDTVKTTLAAYTLGSNVENLTFNGAVAFTGTGNGLDNVITGGKLADTLYGNSGNDTLYGDAGDDTLDGGTDSDTMVGGKGNDTYVVDNAGDVVTEASNAGTDIVQTTLTSYTLAANVENLTFTGTGAFTGTGNAASNVITGGTSNDTLDGGAGNDTLNGGGGDDTLIGGAGVDILQGGIGADIFRFVTATDSKGKTYDTISDFSSAALDKIDLSLFDANTMLAGFQSFTFISSASFTGVAGQLSFSNGFLRADINGDKASDFDVALTGVTSLSINDFWL